MIGTVCTALVDMSFCCHMLCVLLASTPTINIITRRVLLLSLHSLQTPSELWVDLLSVNVSKRVASGSALSVSPSGSAWTATAARVQSLTASPGLVGKQNQAVVAARCAQQHSVWAAPTPYGEDQAL